MLQINQSLRIKPLLRAMTLALPLATGYGISTALAEDTVEITRPAEINTEAEFRALPPGARATIVQRAGEELNRIHREHYALLPEYTAKRAEIMLSVPGLPDGPRKIFEDYLASLSGSPISQEYQALIDQSDIEDPLAYGDALLRAAFRWFMDVESNVIDLKYSPEERGVEATPEDMYHPRYAKALKNDPDCPALDRRVMEGLQQARASRQKYLQLKSWAESE